MWKLRSPFIKGTRAGEGSWGERYLYYKQSIPKREEKQGLQPGGVELGGTPQAVKDVTVKDVMSLSTSRHALIRVFFQTNPLPQRRNALTVKGARNATEDAKLGKFGLKRA
jgi:hypothetical protein